MAASKLLPQALARCAVPQCAACLYAKATKRPWRTRAPPNKVTPVSITRPGDCISVDQLESSVPGLIAQLHGFLTKKRYKCATIFVDHYNRLSYVHLQTSTSGEETLQAKQAFEAFAKTHGVTIQHYHADNGRFVEPLFQQHCTIKPSLHQVSMHIFKMLLLKRELETFKTQLE